MIQQAWTISIEIFFYLFCMSAFALRPKIIIVSTTVLGFIYFVLHTNFVESWGNWLNVVYKDALSMIWLFGLGGVCYFCKDFLNHKFQNYLTHKKAIFNTLSVLLFLCLFSISGGRYFKSYLEENSQWNSLIIISMIGFAILVPFVLEAKFFGRNASEELVASSVLALLYPCFVFAYFHLVFYACGKLFARV